MTKLSDQWKIRKSYRRMALSVFLVGLTGAAVDVLRNGWWPRGIGWLAVVVLLVGVVLLLMRGRVIPD